MAVVRAAEATAPAAAPAAKRQKAAAPVPVPVLVSVPVISVAVAVAVAVAPPPNPVVGKKKSREESVAERKAQKEAYRKAKNEAAINKHEKEAMKFCKTPDEALDHYFQFLIKSKGKLDLSQEDLKRIFPADLFPADLFPAVSFQSDKRIDNYLRIGQPLTGLKAGGDQGIRFLRLPAYLQTIERLINALKPDRYRHKPSLDSVTNLTNLYAHGYPDSKISSKLKRVIECVFEMTVDKPELKVNLSKYLKRSIWGVNQNGSIDEANLLQEIIDSIPEGQMTDRLKNIEQLDKDQRQS